MLPPGISTTTVTFGTAVTNVKRTDLGMKVTFTPTSNLVWASTGTVIIAYTETAVAGSDGNGSIDLINPWQAGFVDGNGNQIINWGYRTVAEYTSGNQTILKTAEKIITWPADTVGPIDLDLLIAVPAASGIIAYLPDIWSASIAQLTSRIAALESGTGSGGGGNPSGGITATDNGNGNYTASGTGVTDNGDGTGTINSSNVTDNGDGTFTLAA